MLRKGFTLIELLIVITIIAILAGAAIPYVADYIDESRTARAKQDMSEIRNALARWELTRSTWDSSTSSIEPLVGPFISQLLIDPWGSPYVIQASASRVISYGPDGTINTGDDLALDFRPPMAVTKVEYLDVDKSGTVNASDSLTFYCTRPVANDTDTGVTVGGVGLSTFAPAMYNLNGTTAVNGTSFRAIASFTSTPAFTSNDVVIPNKTAIGDAGASNVPAVPVQFAKPALLKLRVGGF